MYAIKIKKSAQKELQLIPKPYQAKIIDAIDSLSNEPRPNGVKKLKLSDDLYRIRVADYRIIYSIDDEVEILEVQKIGHRKNIYKP